MKETIDLTENRDFRNHGIGFLRKYNHLSLPWKITKSDFLSLQLTNTRSVSYSNSDIIIENLDELSLETYDNYTNFSTTNDYTTHTYTINNKKYDWSYITNLKVLYFNNDKKDFFTGKAPNIKEQIKLRNSTDLILSNYFGAYYNNRGKNFINQNWKIHYISTMNKPLCKKRNLKDIARGFSSVFCSSKEIPPKEIPPFYSKDISKRHKKRFICWLEYEMKEFIYDFFGRKVDKRRQKYVYFKGKQLERREEHWQPKGRVGQEYDIMFESLNWRNMLRKRINELEKTH